jgi:DNA polymerase III epsilon subunit-like protein
MHSPLAVAFVPLFDADAPLLTYVRPESIAWTEHAELNFQRYEPEWSLNAVGPKAACEVIDAYLQRLCGGQQITLIGHNVGFDLAFLGKLAYLGGRERFDLLSHRSIDIHTMLYLLCLQQRIPISALTSDGAFRYFGIDIPQSLRHTALADALATRVLFVRVLRLLLGRDDVSDQEVAFLLDNSSHSC